MRELTLKQSLNFLLCAACICGTAGFIASCGQYEPAGKSTTTETAKPAAPSVPQDVQDAAKALLGNDVRVLVFGDLAKNGKQQFLAANVLPKTPTSIPGTIVTRTVVAENDNGKWSEILRCDEQLKNTKGFLAGTPLAPITGWKLQYEQDSQKGLQLYFTPVNGTGDSHVLPIGVRWNPATRRYQSLDRTYEHFLNESVAMEPTHSTLR